MVERPPSRVRCPSLLHIPLWRPSPRAPTGQSTRRRKEESIITTTAQTRRFGRSPTPSRRRSRRLLSPALGKSSLMTRDAPTISTRPQRSLNGSCPSSLENGRIVSFVSNVDLHHQHHLHLLHQHNQVSRFRHQIRSKHQRRQHQS